MQWQAKAKTRRHGQNQPCKFCGQKIGIWAHYATCAKRPNSLLDIEADIYFESARTVTLADTLYDPGCVKLIDRNYPLFDNRSKLHRHVTKTLDTVKKYLRSLENLIYTRKMKKDEAVKEHKQLKQLKQPSIRADFR